MVGLICAALLLLGTWRTDVRTYQATPDRDDWRLEFGRYAGPRYDAGGTAPSALPAGAAIPRGSDPRLRDDPNWDYDALDRWLKANVWDRGWSADLGTGDIFDPETGEVKGKVPAFYRVN